jgi:hypothetical protein
MAITRRNVSQRNSSQKGTGAVIGAVLPYIYKRVSIISPPTHLQVLSRELS